MPRHGTRGSVWKSCCGVPELIRSLPRHLLAGQARKAWSHFRPVNASPQRGAVAGFDYILDGAAGSHINRASNEASRETPDVQGS
jgi:hypothetical protein